MDISNDEIKIINFIEDFGCCRIGQLEVLFKMNKVTLKNILKEHYINKKNDIIVFKNKEIDKKMLAAIDVLCKYKGRYKYFKRNFEPIYITFLSSKNEVYDIIVSEKKDEEGIIKMLNKTTNWNADKLILLFEDERKKENINIRKPYLYCTYPEIKIIN